MRSSQIHLLQSLFLGCLMVLVSCQPQDSAPPVLSAVEWRNQSKADAAELKQLHRDNLQLRSDFIAFQSHGGWQKRGYFSADEMDRMEGLLFRYHVIHRRLLAIHDRYSDTNLFGVEHVPEAGRQLHLETRRQMLAQAEFAVKTFSGDSLAIERMNQRYPRTEIPPRTYDHLVSLLESPLARDVSLLGKKLGDDIKNISYNIQAEVFFRVSRFKSPRAYLIHFSDAQKDEVINLLEPGDIILSYTAGYVSSYFIPGTFKHAMVYIGSVEDRRRIGLVGSRVALPGGSVKEKEVRQAFLQTTTTEGRQANMIEAVAEGVKFSDLRYVMDTHINRLVVIRPRLSRHDKIQYLSLVYSYLGQEYDFQFDFSDASRQVCTEVVYRSLNGLGGVDYPLSKHAGRLALTADDVVNYWLDQQPDGFEFVLYAAESPWSPSHAAKVWTGEAGKKRLIKALHSD